MSIFNEFRLESKSIEVKQKSQNKKSCKKKKK